MFNVSDRYAVVLVTYISQSTTVFFGIKEFHEGTAMEFHEGTAMEFHEGCICCAAYVVFAAQHPERSWQFQIMTAILDVFVLSEGRPRCFPTVAGYVATPAILSKGSDPCAPIDSHLQPTCKEECPGKDTFA